MKRSANTTRTSLFGVDLFERHDRVRHHLWVLVTQHLLDGGDHRPRRFGIRSVGFHHCHHGSLPHVRADVLEPRLYRLQHILDDFGQPAYSGEGGLGFGRGEGDHNVATSARRGA